MKKFIKLGLFLSLVLVLVTGCGGANNFTGNSASIKESPGLINIVSREDGSGTKGAFIEIVGILEKDSSGQEIDRTYEEAIIQNSTDAVMTTVAGDQDSIGYISLGSLNDTVQAVKVNNVEPNSNNIQEGSYKITRPFNIAYKNDLNPLRRDFVNFIFSPQGQAIVEEEGYIPAITDLTEYISSRETGDLTISGSTSVSPVMEKLAEKYEELNPNVSIEIQSTGSSAGIQSLMEASADIGMASRELKDSEKTDLIYKPMAIDGVVVITNLENPINNMSLDEIRSIYMGEITSWDLLNK